MSFVSPLWLWALSGLAVPLAIHLLSRGRRQRVAIGTVRHLTGSESRALRRVRLSGWPQMLVRMLLLAVVSVAMAGPRWPASDERGRAGTWVLIDPDLATEGDGSTDALDEFQRQIEIARREADAVRLLMPGLPDVEDESVQDRHEDAWSLLREVDELAPAGTRLQVFSRDRVAWLRGRRPVLSRPVQWSVLADTDTNRWIQRATLTDSGDLVVTVGTSQAEGTGFRIFRWPVQETPPEISGLRADPDSGALGLIQSDALPEDDQTRYPVGSPAFRVAVLVGPERNVDADHVRRAVTTVARYLGRQVSWVESGESPVDLEIRLGLGQPTEPVPWIRLSDRESRYESCQGRAHVSSQPGSGGLHLKRCALQVPSPAGVGLWLDSWGRPFLWRQAGSHADYVLQGRFDTRWSNLVISPVLPRLLLDLLVPEDRAAGGAGSSRSDRRATTGSERLPRISSLATEPSGGLSSAPEVIGWIVGVLLLVLERWISGRTA